MNYSEVNLLPSISTNNWKFEANDAFQRRDPAREADAGFLKYTKKTWMQPKGDQRRTREVIATLLASSDGDDGENDCIEKLMAEDVSYSDLGSLTQSDLDLMGIKDSKQQAELLQFFQLLPNQDPSYNSILQLPEAKTYNSRILNNATSHLEMMQAALSVANYKLKIMPVQDVIVDQKYFASKFVLEAVSELQNVTNEIDLKLTEIDELIKHKSKNTLCKKKHLKTGFWILMSSIASAALAAIWFLKYSK